MHFLDQTSVHFMPQTPVFGFRLAKAPSDQMLLVLLGLALPLQSESTAQSPQLAPGARRWTQQPPLAYVAQGELTLVARGAAAAQGKAEEGEVVEEWEETIQEEGPGWSRQEQVVVTAVVGGSHGHVLAEKLSQVRSGPRCWRSCARGRSGAPTS